MGYSVRADRRRSGIATRARPEESDCEVTERLGQHLGSPPTQVADAQADQQVRQRPDHELALGGEVRRMGANVELRDAQHATISGPSKLVGKEVEIGDLRAGASLILAALAADGESTIHGAHHVERGYENIERKFADLGARIARLEEGTVSTSS